MKIEIAFEARAQAGESPVWCERRGLLFWVDIGLGRLHAFDPATGNGQHWELGQPVACIGLTEGEELVLGLRDGLFRFSPQSGTCRLLAECESDQPENRPNDAAMSRDGRFFFGTMQMQPDGKPHGTLYRLDPNGVVTPLLDGLHVPNGLAVSPDNRRLYLSDSWRDIHKIWTFDLDNTGAISGRKLWFDTAGQPGRPDGGCIDAEGHYWMAGIDGGQLLRLSPDGTVKQAIDLPVRKPTKACFGGPDLRTLFVTSLGAGDASEHAGALMALRPGVAGLPEPRMTI